MHINVHNFCTQYSTQYSSDNLPGNHHYSDAVYWREWADVSHSDKDKTTVLSTVQVSQLLRQRHKETNLRPCHSHRTRHRSRPLSLMVSRQHRPRDLQSTGARPQRFTTARYLHSQHDITCLPARSIVSYQEHVLLGASQEMRPIVTDRAAWSLGRSVCHSREPCKNRRIDLDVLWVVDSGGPKK